MHEIRSFLSCQFFFIALVHRQGNLALTSKLDYFFAMFGLGNSKVVDVFPVIVPAM